MYEHREVLNLLFGGALPWKTAYPKRPIYMETDLTYMERDLSTKPTDSTFDIPYLFRSVGAVPQMTAYHKRSVYTKISLIHMKKDL